MNRYDYAITQYEKVLLLLMCSSSIGGKEKPMSIRSETEYDSTGRSEGFSTLLQVSIMVVASSRVMDESVVDEDTMVVQCTGGDERWVAA